MEDAGATVTVNSTLRPEERAYLMHYSWEIAKNGMDPTAVPAKSGVDIEWAHKKADGSIDKAASKTAAQAMVDGYHIVYEPALHSRHTEGHAVDMTIRWQGALNIRDNLGNTVNIQSAPHTGLNPQLIDVGRSYDVIKLVSDPPHWSTDGH